MSTSQKHRNFVSEPMGDKLVTELAGIGPVLGRRLVEAGFNHAYMVLGQYLLLGMNESRFKEWLKDVCNANSKQQEDCYCCLQQKFAESVVPERKKGQFVLKPSQLKTSWIMGTSLKYKKFVSEPMGNKPVTELAGIEPDIGRKLEAGGIYFAYRMLGQFLLMKKDEDQFKQWLFHICGANGKQQDECYYCLRDWCQAFL